MAAGDVSGAYTQLRGIACNLFDMVDDYIDIPHSNFQLGSSLTKGFTISAWIYAKSLGESSAGGIVVKNSAVDGTGGFTFRLAAVTGDRLRFQLNAGVAKNSEVISDLFNKWHHVMVTCSSTPALNFYIDGVLTGTANQGLDNPLSAITTTNNIRVGSGTSAATTYTFDGGIAQVHIWDRVLTTSEIAQDYAGTPPTNSLIHNFKLGGDYTDYGSVGVTATNSGSVATIVDDQLRARLKAQYVGAGDKFMIADVGNGGILSVSIEGG